ncbi:class II aldolase/adducin family protein [Petropleomorpha daqingensis]|uniref:Rhamnose utilization protein RhaD (Predicted bifunctional aldolase and dehydrogenase) n=1 Tax=Petropleomorpha daqingensis TaxID=2026353 RepID=A0A853CBX2_9ACTN|nr:rhamnose utilization protein RhaD (predicted bifunctional aldolase and dehydrogenase) [Petropleomorpha daqingensis]
MGSEVLDELNRHAAAIGDDLRLVQGAGGNLSGKDGGLVWVKASGTRLGEALDRPIFVGVDGPRAREDVLRMEDLRHVVVELADERASRPSIETALHVLLPHRYVFHVHSVGAVAAAAQREPAAVLDRLREVAPVAWVPYAKPGIALARAVLAAQEAAGDSAETVFLLGNHGLLTAAGTADRTRELIDEAEAVLRADDTPLTPGGDDPTELAPAGSLDAAGTRMLVGGVLTPDEAVFLGRRPFADAPDAGGSAVVTSEGAVLVREDLSADAREIALSFVAAATHADPAAPVRYLDDDEVDALVDWEAEKWRRGMER